MHFYNEKHLAICRHHTSLSLLERYKHTADETIVPPDYKSHKMQGMPIVRIHSSCFTGEVIGSLRCDCGEQLREALRTCDVVVYLYQEGRNIGLYNKLRAYNLQDRGYDTVSANEALGLPVDDRQYESAYEILYDLGIDEVKLMTNNPAKVQQLRQFMPVKRVPTIVSHGHPETTKYLECKKHKLSHLL